MDYPDELKRKMDRDAWERQRDEFMFSYLNGDNLAPFGWQGKQEQAQYAQVNQ